MHRLSFTAGILHLIVAGSPLQAQLGPVDLFGEIGVESRVFFSRPLSQEQPRWHSLSLSSEVRYEQVLGDHLAARATLFGRLDESDSRRSHVDVREALIQITGDALSLDLGINTVFWGVTESRHLVDIVNQLDYLEDLSGDDRFGQLMARISYATEARGLFEMFAMTWFRPQRYPGREGRPGVPTLVLDGAPLYESGRGDRHPDFAFRWSHSVSEFDWGLSYFRGTTREPELRPTLYQDELAILPVYALIHQVGIEFQWTKGNWLWKLEGVIREGQGSTFTATTLGLEHTYSSAFGGPIDLGTLVEYSYDGRDNLTLNSYDNDLFLGARLSFNDIASTELLMGTVADVQTGVLLYAIEGSRRLGDRWTIDVRGRGFSVGDEADPLYWFRRDHYLQTAVTLYF